MVPLFSLLVIKCMYFIQCFHALVRLVSNWVFGHSIFKEIFNNIINQSTLAWCVDTTTLIQCRQCSCRTSSFGIIGLQDFTCCNLKEIYSHCMHLGIYFFCTCMTSNSVIAPFVECVAFRLWRMLLLAEFNVKSPEEAVMRYLLNGNHFMMYTSLDCAGIIHGLWSWQRA